MDEYERSVKLEKHNLYKSLYHSYNEYATFPNNARKLVEAVDHFPGHFLS